MPIDDNTKLTVADYRDRLYNEVLKRKKEQRKASTAVPRDIRSMAYATRTASTAALAPAPTTSGLTSQKSSSNLATAPSKYAPVTTAPSSTTQPRPVSRPSGSASLYQQRQPLSQNQQLGRAPSSQGASRIKPTSTAALITNPVSYYPYGVSPNPARFTAPTHAGVSPASTAPGSANRPTVSQQKGSSTINGSVPHKLAPSASYVG